MPQWTISSRLAGSISRPPPSIALSIHVAQRPWRLGSYHHANRRQQRRASTSPLRLRDDSALNRSSTPTAEDGHRRTGVPIMELNDVVRETEPDANAADRTHEISSELSAKTAAIDSIIAKPALSTLYSKQTAADMPGGRDSVRSATTNTLESANRSNFYRLTYPVNWRPRRWLECMPTLIARNSKHTPDEERANHMPTSHVRAAEWAEEMSEMIDRGETTLNIIAAADRDDVHPMSMWLSVCLWFLTYDPSAAIPWLAVKFTNFSVPPDVVREALWIISLHYTYVVKDTSALDMTKMADILCDLVTTQEDMRFYSNSTTIWFLLKNCDFQVAQKVYAAITKHKTTVNGHTYLHFAQRFAREGRLSSALDALDRARECNTAIDSSAFRSVCATVLRASMREDDGARLCWRAVEQLIQMGVTIDAGIRDIMILNAVKSGNVDLAFTLTHSLAAEGILPNEHTVHLLVLACQLDIDNIERLQDAIQTAIKYIDVRQHPLIADTILQTLALHHSKHNPNNAYQMLVDAYSEIYDPSPLKRLGLAWPNQRSTAIDSNTNAPKLTDPTRYSLGIMIRAYIILVLHDQRASEQVLEIYRRWRKFVEFGERPYAELASTDNVSNAFLAAFNRHRASIPYAAEVIRDMLQPLPPSAGKAVQAVPSAKTWNIFLHGFVRHGMSKLAENSVERMRAAGIEPTQATWDTLLNGYTATQDVSGSAETVLRLEEAGLTWTDYTFRAVAKLIDQAALQRELDRGRGRRNLDFSSELKITLRDRILNAPPYETADSRLVNQTQSGDQISISTPLNSSLSGILQDEIARSDAGRV